METMVGYNIKCPKKFLWVCKSSKKRAKQRATHNGLTLKNRQISSTGTKMNIVSKMGAKRMASSPLL